jgi:hypothetical protein
MLELLISLFDQFLKDLQNVGPSISINLTVFAELSFDRLLAESIHTDALALRGLNETPFDLAINVDGELSLVGRGHGVSQCEVLPRGPSVSIFSALGGVTPP